MKRYLFPALLFILSMVFLSINISDLTLPKGDENYYFSSARRMLRENDLVTPRYHDRVRFEKPILYYWLVALFFKLFGVSWAAARMTSVVFASLTVLVTYILSVRLLPERPARYAPAILATTFLFFRYARIAVIDMTFLFLITLSLFLFLKGEREDKRRYFIFSAAPLGLAVMAKGPLAIAIAGLTAMSYLIAVKRLKYPGWPSLIVSALVVSLIALPWPIAMYRIHGAEYLKHLWETETVNKAMGSVINLKTVANMPRFLLRYIGYYIPVIVFSFVPWSLFLPFGLIKRARTNTGKDRAFLRCWFWTVFVFFTIISFKHTHYMLLLSPALAMLIAGLFEESKDGIISKKIPAVVLAAAAVFYIFVAAFTAPLAEDGALKIFSLRLAAEVQGPDEEIGIVSKGPNIKKLGIHLNNLVSTVDELSGDDLARYTMVDKEAVEQFLRSKSRVYCIISKEDYERRLTPALQRSVYILDKSAVWKKFKPGLYLQKIRQGDWEGLKDEVYLISNRG